MNAKTAKLIAREVSRQITDPGEESVIRRKFRALVGTAKEYTVERIQVLAGKRRRVRNAIKAIYQATPRPRRAAFKQALAAGNIKVA